MASGKIYKTRSMETLDTYKTATLYSGDGVAAYTSSRYTLSFTIPTGYTLGAVKEITTSNGDFISSCLNLDNSSGTAIIKLFNCSDTVAYPGTITMTVLCTR